MGKVTSALAAGSIVRRVREDRGISRAALAEQTGIGARTIYALERGESRNFGLESYLKLLEVLGLDMRVDLADSPATKKTVTPIEAELLPELELGSIWTLGGVEK